MTNIEHRMSNIEGKTQVSLVKSGSSFCDENLENSFLKVEELEIIHYVLEAFTLTIHMFLSLFLPIIGICILLNLIAREHNKRLYEMAGWKGLLATAWIGTPIHEISHAITAVLFGHKIRQLALFSPDPKTGTLGYLEHSYNSRSFYQDILGNSVIAIAPFFGGAAAIYLILYLLLPEFSLYSTDVPQIFQLTSENFRNGQSYTLFFNSVLRFYQYFIDLILSTQMLSSWKFYVALFILFGIGSHLSPSYSDFRSFWQPLGVIIFFMTVVNLLISPHSTTSMKFVNSLGKYVFLVMPVLLLALFICIVGLIIIYVFFVFIVVLRK